ncbi:hypothetical protein [Novosphingobium sp. SG707]|uniref:hypothetical protein n=1 Tax=Novosphingobium sp. SG707 TaxID=2586996 RepID=UPI001B2FECA3|nr:hypothetical protein [Novosphingobium sp. SG707]
MDANPPVGAANSPHEPNAHLNVIACMDSLRYPTPDLPGFQLPGDNAPRDVWEHAFEQMRSVDLTWEQVQQGYAASLGPDGAFGDIVRLRAWCEAQGLVPADVAAEAILVRMSPVIEHMSEAEDFDEAAQEEMAMRELDVRFDVLEFVGASVGWAAEDLNSRDLAARIRTARRVPVDLSPKGCAR